MNSHDSPPTHRALRLHYPAIVLRIPRRRKIAATADRWRCLYPVPDDGGDNPIRMKSVAQVPPRPTQRPAHRTGPRTLVVISCSCPCSLGPRASGGRSVRLPAPGIGLFGDPCEVVRVSVDDRPCGHAGDLVGVLALGAGNDLGYPLTSGVQRYPALGPLVYLALPSVD